MAEQKLIHLSTSTKDGVKKYTGRFLGFIKDDEFNALMKNPDKVSTRLESKATQPIVEVASKFDDVVGYRLVMTVKKIDGENILKKMLFISERIEIIDSVVPASDTGDEKKKVGKVTFRSANQEDVIVQEAE